MPEPKASLIISVYTNTVFLKAVLDALKYQTCKDFEILISEDGESPEMKKFLNAYPFEQPWQHLTQSDIGWRKNQALNRAILASRSNYLVFIDGDCILHARFMEMHLRYANEKMILGGKRVKLNEKLTQQLLQKTLTINEMNSFLFRHFFQLRKMGFRFHEEGLFIRPNGLFGFIPRLRKMSQLKGCNMSFHKKSILDINGFDEDYIRPAIGEDIDLTWRFQRAGYKLGSVRNIAVQYHLNHKENWSDQEDNIRMMEHKQLQNLFFCQNGIQKV